MLHTCASGSNVAFLIRTGCISLLLLASACQHQQLPTTAEDLSCVVTLHGLARSDKSMQPLAQSMQKAGYFVVNLQYPSRTDSIENLADKTLPAAFDACRIAKASPVHIVTHSMGGILVRQYLAHHHPPELGRVVMLSPPNQGSELVDSLKHWPGFNLVAGTAGQQLGTADESLPRQLPPVQFELGVVAGTATVNPLFSALIPGDDDGTVSTESTRVEGMQDFLLVPETHTFIMRSEEVIRQTIWFIRNGQFDHENKQRL